MANIELAKAYVTIVPSMQGAQQTIAEELAAAGSSAGNAAGNAAGSGFSSGLSRAFSTVSNIAGSVVNAVGSAVSAVSREVTSFVSSSVNAGMSFDASMSQVAATMGTTVDQITELRDFAQQMGATTAFSATQAADALNYMALAGYDAETSMEMLPNVLNLAAAGSINLARASDMVTDAQSALGLSLDETTTMVDQMARASSLTNTSVEQLGDAFLTIGATASNMAGGTNELAVMLGVLADNGIKGAEGGTHLRNMILSLTNPTDTAAGYMEALGLQIYDSEGNMRSMIDIMNDLNYAMQDYTQEGRDVVTSALFNRADMASVNALLNTQAERYDELTEALNDASGAAENMADTQLDNLSGDMTLFRSALEGVQIAISDMVTPVFREFVQFGSEALGDITTALQDGGIDSALEVVGQKIEEGIEMVSGFVNNHLDTILNVGSNILITLVNGIIANMPTLMSAATTVLTSLCSALMAALPSLAGPAMDMVLMVASTIILNLPTLVPVALDLVMELVAFILDNLGLILDAAIQIVIAVANGIADNLDTLVPSVISAVLTICETLTNPDMLLQLVDAALRIMVALGLGLIEALPEVLSRIPEILGNIISAFAQLGPMLLQGAAEWAADLIDGLVSGITNGITRVQGAVSSIAQGIRDFIGFSEPEEGPLSDFHTYMPDMFDLLEEGIEEGAPELEATLNSALAMPALGQPAALAEGYGSFGASESLTPVNIYIGQEKLDTIMLRSSQNATYRRGG